MAYKDKAKKAEYARAYYAAHKAERDAYQKAYNAANSERVAAANKARYEAHKAERKVTDAAWKAAHREELCAYALRSRTKYPEKMAARRAVRTEIATGRWPAASGQVCEICGEAQAQQYHHHLGYEPEHWLHAQAVCRECHYAEHFK